MIKDQLQDFGKRIWTQFTGFSAGQKAVTIVATLALVIGGYFFLTWKPAPTYAALYTNLGASDASAIVDKLNSQGVPYKLSNGGTEIDVPQDSVYSTRLAMSSAGLPDGGDTGYALLDKEGVTTSQFQQQVDYQRAIEGELAKTIKSVNGVSDASVHLAIPQQDVFNDGSQKPTAAVLLTLDSGSQLTSQQVESIVYLVSSSVPSMKSGDVTVTDSDGNVLAAPGQGTGGVAGIGDQAQMTASYNNQIAASVQHMIDAAIGPGHAQVTVNATMDYNQTKTTESHYVYDKKAPPVSETTTKETYKGAGTPGAGGVDGGSNGTGTTGGTNGTGTGGSGKYEKTSSTVNNALGTVTQVTENAPGTVKNLNVGVLLDKSVKSLDVPALTNLIKSSVGFTAARGDQLSVQAMPFTTAAAGTQAATDAAAAKAEAAAAAHDQLISEIKLGSLGLLILILVLGSFISGRKRRKRAAAPQANDDILFLDDQDEREPELASVTDLQTAAARRRSLVAAADDRPDDLARALSGWLNTKES